MAQGFWSLLGKLYPGRRWRVQGEASEPAIPGDARVTATGDTRVTSTGDERVIA